jgi:hypothetical protein
VNAAQYGTTMGRFANRAIVLFAWMPLNARLCVIIVGREEQVVVRHPADDIRQCDERPRAPPAHGVREAEMEREDTRDDELGARRGSRAGASGAAPPCASRGSPLGPAVGVHACRSALQRVRLGVRERAYQQRERREEDGAIDKSLRSVKHRLYKTLLVQTR